MTHFTSLRLAHKFTSVWSSIHIYKPLLKMLTKWPVHSIAWMYGWCNGRMFGIWNRRAELKDLKILYMILCRMTYFPLCNLFPSDAMSNLSRYCFLFPFQMFSLSEFQQTDRPRCFQRVKTSEDLPMLNFTTQKF